MKFIYSIKNLHQLVNNQVLNTETAKSLINNASSLRCFI
jgi:hypothetical protein